MDRLALPRTGGSTLVAGGSWGPRDWESLPVARNSLRLVTTINRPVTAFGW